MQQYNELPAMPAPVMPALPSGLADAEALGVLSTLAMRCGGCGAKVGASVLERALHRVGAMQRDEVLIGLGSPDDAAVIATSDGRASVHTIDFFRAMIDDPFVFGQIAATHALSDVYAMGGEPDSALALVTLPPGPEPKQEEMLAHLLSGAVAVLKPAGATLVGGHTSESAELGLGFSVNGRVDPARVMRKSGLQPGDRLIVTKALGTGTLFAADMRHRAKGRWIAGAIRSMLQSNREAACCLQAHGATACTDVTGFGFVGHLVEMLNASGMAAELQLHAVPLLEGAEETIAWGIFSSLQPQNIRLRRAMTADAPVARHPRYASLFDPQTSGGLLAGVPAAAAAACVHELHLRGYVTSAVIGTVLPRDDRTEIIAVRG
jgi:selenide,water dikinase